MTGSRGSGARRAIVCDVRGVVEADACTVDALARLQLMARRCGCEIRLANAGPELRELLRVMGLEGALPADLEPRGQAEEREQARGIQEERDPTDPVP